MRDKSEFFHSLCRYSTLVPDKINLLKSGAFHMNNCCKIYIVDDDEQQAHLMQAMAETADLETILYTSSLEFLSTAINPFDIVVLDLQMPEKDGIEIMRELAAQNIKPAFILVSGFDERVLHSARQLAESKQLNVITTLSKPIKAKHFITLLKETFNKCNQNYLQHSEKDSPPEQTSSVLEQPDVKHSENIITIDELKLGIRQHQLKVHFQPQVSLDNSDLKGAEVLVRWQHPKKGLLLAEHFIPLAENHMLMNLLTEEILKLTIAEYHKLTARKINIKVSINLSSQNVTDLAMPEKLARLIKSNHIEPESIELEISESALMNEISDSLDILNRLRMKGFSLSLDDFGSGYSSLVKLYQAPFAELKIDQHFVMRMTQDPDAVAIVRICILLAKELKMRAVAKNVESEEVWNQLKKLGCDTAQGNFIAKPMPTDDFINWVNNREACEKDGTT